MLSRERQSARMSKITNDGLTRSDMMLYSCTPMATVGVKGLSMVITNAIQAAAGINSNIHHCTTREKKTATSAISAWTNLSSVLPL